MGMKSLSTVENAGRDHWVRSLALALAGGGFKRGHAHGTTDPQGMTSTGTPPPAALARHVIRPAPDRVSG